MLTRRLYSGFSRGAGAARSAPPPSHGAHSSGASGSGSGSTAYASRSTNTASNSTRGRTKSSRQHLRVRSLYSPPQWVSQLIHGQQPPAARGDGMTIRTVPIESIESLLQRHSSRRGRTRPFASRRAAFRASEKSMAEMIKETKPLVQNPLAKDYTFRPVPLYPAAFHAHLAFNPPHLPIPSNLGTAIYSQPRKPSSSDRSSTDDIFSIPQPPSPFRKLARAQSKAQTAMTEHMAIISALSHPSHLSALPTGFEALSASAATMGMPDVEEHLARTLAEAETKNQILAERDFTKAMDMLEGAVAAQEDVNVQAKAESAEVEDVQGQAQAQMQDVLQGVEALLGRLNVSAKEMDVADMGEDVIEMDSVKRKRKKKISKHKYKKRRKATRAQRKRLGK